MGIQGNKATTHEHDFLSLCTAAAKDSSSLQLHDAKPSPPSQGFFLRTHDFLQPLEKPTSSSRHHHHHHQQALPGGIGTFSIGHVAGARPVAAAAVVKAEPTTQFVLWGQPAAAPPVAALGHHHHHQWTLPFAGVAQVATAARQPQTQAQERKVRVGGGGFMDSGSRSSGGAGFDDDDGLAARREVSSSLKDLTVRVDGKGGSCSGSGTDQRPNTPRSKHSATEQRRRSKINDRFQILRELLPHSDQKRDKATFLLEVIEYIRFLQEKVQKYETSAPEWNQENAKILPWSNIYFRSFWKNSQSKGQTPGDDLPDPSQFIRNGSSSGFNFTGKPDDNHTMVTSAAASGAQEQLETDHTASVSYRSAETPTNITNNVTSQVQTQWASPSGVDDCAMNSEILNNQQLAIDEGTISLSTQYSQQLLGTLTHALESSGVDLSQASLSVQINLGKRAVKRPGGDGSSSSKELPNPSSNNENMGHQLTMLGGGAEELPHSTKRHKSGNS
ncbi:transcription factor BIM2 isoform X2 [Oryza brachyantha]|uniref:transcription factor BIM2 isoform X2 n=1 Tax=Oryza brachyantha TaxID=4533 RepID=UPI001ADBBBC7|nr:transcription factor BIM2 isoform X2 [Oryza brachyantha]